jgi:hypothetical protein
MPAVSIASDDDDFFNIDNRVKVSSLQLQRAFAFVVQEYNYESECLMADPDSCGVRGCRRCLWGACFRHLPQRIAAQARA